MALSIRWKRGVVAAGFACTIAGFAAPPASGGIDSTASLEFRVAPFAGQLSLRATGDTPTVSLGRFRFGIVSEVEYSPQHSESPWLRYVAGARAVLPLSNGGLWLEYGKDHQQQSGRQAEFPVFEGGAQVQRGAVVVKTRARQRTLWLRSDPYQVWRWEAPDSFQSPPDEIPQLPYWVYPDAMPASVTSLDMEGSWTRSRWTFAAGGGIALGKRFAPIWRASLFAERWFRRGLSMIVGGEYIATGRFSEEYAAGPRVQLGVFVEPQRLFQKEGKAITGSSASEELTWVLARLGEHLYSVRVRYPGARSVLLRGDFSDWDSIAMTETESGWWGVTLALSPGVHRVEVSVDGGDWLPPNGAPTLDGEYGEAVGTFVAE